MFIKHSYLRGYLTELRRGDNNALLYSLPQYNVRGQLTNFMYGNGIQTVLGYDTYGFPASNLVESGGVLNLNCSFDPGTGNLNWRNDHTYRVNLHEGFSYDDYSLHKRLTGWGENDEEQFSIIYHSNGNIRCKTDISAYTPNAIEYSPVKPHALTQLNYPTSDYLDFVEGQNQEITYNAFDKTETIEQGNKRLEFVYGPDQSRKIMKTYQKEGGNFVLKKTKYYILGNTEIEVEHPTSKTRTLNYIGGQAILEQSPTEEKLYYLHKDYQGSLLAVTDESGDVVQRFAYDPWGRRRDPGSWRNLTASEIEQGNFLFARGYTGHEHLDGFGLINMNGRMYDPLLGRMLSPDNYVQAPDNSQNFNRYSYALNNPLIYTDPSGEFFQALFFAGAFITDYASNLINGVHDPLGTAYNNVTNTISGMNNCAQIPIYNNGGTSITAGVSPFNLGVGVNIYQSNGNATVHTSAGIGFISGLYVDGGITYDFGDFSLSAGSGYSSGQLDIFDGVRMPESSRYYGGATYFDQTNNQSFSGGLTYFGGEFSQYNWYGGYQKGDFSFSMTNDAWTGSDKFRTAAAEIGIGDFSYGFNLFTTTPPESEYNLRPQIGNDKTYTSFIWGRNPRHTYSSGSRVYAGMYIGYRNGNNISRMGIDAPWVQDFFQNGIHRHVVKTPYFNTNYGPPTRFFGQSGHYFPYSLYNF